MGSVDRMSDMVDGMVREFRYSRKAALGEYSGITWPPQCFGLEGVDVDDIRDSVRGGGRQKLLSRRHRLHLGLPSPPPGPRDISKLGFWGIARNTFTVVNYSGQYHHTISKR